MGLYEQWVLPRLVELAMRSRRLVPYREQLIKAPRGRVLEIGVGSGLNLPIYGTAVDQVYGIDLSPELLDRAGKRMGDTRVPVSLVRPRLSNFPSLIPHSIPS
jgi:protein-L-isoaspartate O-methyltransferase